LERDYRPHTRITRRNRLPELSIQPARIPATDTWIVKQPMPKPQAKAGAGRNTVTLMIVRTALEANAPKNEAECVQQILDSGDLLVGIGILNEFMDAKRRGMLGGKRCEHSHPIGNNRTCTKCDTAPVRTNAIAGEFRTRGVR
jgi:hypothetical protein